MLGRLVSLAEHQLARNIVALFGARAVHQLLPLVTVPYLARVLGPEEWGILAVAQVFAMYCIYIVQYGFEFAGTREVARHRGSPERVAELMGGILGCQLLLASVAAAAGLLAQATIPALGDRPLLLWAAVAFALAEGFTPFWYYQGIERIPLFAAIATGTRLAATVLIFGLVEAPEDSWMVPATYAVAALLSTAIGYLLAFREVRPRRPDLTAVGCTLRLGFGMFLLRLGTSLKEAGNPLLMALLVGPLQVALYAAPEKLTRPLAWLIHPIHRAVLPRLSHLVDVAPDQGHRIAHLMFRSLTVVAIFIGLMVALLAPRLIELVFGSGYEQAVPVLRVLALLIPLLVVNDVLTTQWMIPLRLDRLLTLLVGASVVLNLILAFLIVPRYQAVGMAWVAVVVEAATSVGLLLALLGHGCNPFTVGRIRRETGTAS